MSTTAIVSGAQPRADEVTDLLRDVGFDVAATVTGMDELRSVATRQAAGSIGCYVQLPGDIEARGDTVLARVRNFLADGLIARFEGVEAVLQALAPNAVVVLVAGNHPADTQAPDNHAARRALLETLAACLLIEKSGEGVRPVVVRGDRTNAEIAAAARDPDHEREAAFARLEDASPGVSFSDWREELLALVHTYT